MHISSMRLLASAASFWLWLLAYVNARELRGLEQGGVFIAGSSYTLRLAFIAPGNSSVRYGGFMDSGHGCPVSSKDNSIPSPAPVLSAVDSGLPTHFALESLPGVPNLPSSAFILRATSRVNCPSIVTRVVSPCPTGLKFSSFPSLATYWVAEPVPRTLPSLGLYYVKAYGLGKNCPNLYLGVVKSCANRSCVVQTFPGPANNKANLIWSLTNLNPPPAPRPNFLGLDLNGPENYYFTFGANLASVRYSVLPETRDFQITFSVPDTKVTWVTDKPYHLSGSGSLNDFVQKFETVLGTPNVIVTGVAFSIPVELVLQLSSPVYNATRKTLSFSATRVGPPLLAELLFIQVHGNITIGSVQVFVDSLILDIIFGSFSFGAQVLNQYGVTALGGGVGWQIASLALVTIIEAFTPKSSGPAPATQAELQAVAASLQQVLTLVTDVSIEVEELVSLVQGLGTDYQAFDANASIAIDIANSGPSAYPPLAPGSILSCPNPSLWTNSILLGAGSGALTLNVALQYLIASIQGASAQTGVNLVAQIFNQAGNMDCSNSGCNYDMYTESSYTIPSASPVVQVMQTMNQYVATMVQGLAICNVAASFVSNTSALQAQGCSPPSSNIPSDYCTALTGLNAPNLLNETYKAITTALDPSNVGYQGYLWRDFDFTEPTSPCVISQVSPDVTDTIWAPTGALLTALRFNTVQLSGNGGGCVDTSFRNYKKTGFMSGEMEMSSSCLNSNSYLTLEATIDSPTLAQGTASYGYNWTVTSISAVNGVGTTEVDGTWWISNTSQMTSSPLASSCGSSAGSNYNEAVQYISLQPVILPEGMFAVGASLITWTCNLPQATFYDCPVEFFNPGDSDQQWVGSGCGGNVRIPGEGDGYEYSDPWEETFMGGGSVLGLQILAATISFDNSTGQMLVGPYSKISNAGDCTNLNFFDQTSGDWVLPTSITNNMPNDPGSGTFYPSPSPWGSPPSQTPFLQLYTSSKYNGNNAGYQNSQGGSPNIMVDNNNGAPAPSFLGGAAIWLKGNRIAIGLNTVPTLFATNEEVSIDAPPPPPS